MGIIRAIITAINNRKLLEHLSLEEEWVMQHIWNYKEDVATKELLAELQEEIPNFTRIHFSYIVQRCAEKQYLRTYRKGRTGMIHCLINIIDVETIPKIEAEM